MTVVFVSLVYYSLGNVITNNEGPLRFNGSPILDTFSRHILCTFQIYDNNQLHLFHSVGMVVLFRFVQGPRGMSGVTGLQGIKGDRV